MAIQSLIESAGPLLHVAAGCVAAAAAPLAMVARKGGRWHRLGGRTFFWAMAVVFATGVTMSLANSNVFLLLVSIFSFYLVLSGYRALYLKRPSRAIGGWYRAGPIDRGAAQFMLAASAIMLIWASMQFPSDPRAPALAAFGLIGAVLAWQDIRRLRLGARTPDQWLFEHMVRMLAGVIAMATAVLVVNAPDWPPLLRWLAPTVAGGIGITLWVRHWRRRLAEGTPLAALLQVKIVEPAADQP